MYDGNYKNGLKDGKGTYTSPGGKKYEVDWLKDRRTGYGKFKWPNRVVYECYFKSGLREGKGTYTHVNGKVVEGKWHEDEFLGP